MSVPEVLYWGQDINIIPCFSFTHKRTGIHNSTLGMSHLCTVARSWAQHTSVLTTYHMWLSYLSFCVAFASFQFWQFYSVGCLTPHARARTHTFFHFHCHLSLSRFIFSSSISRHSLSLLCLFFLALASGWARSAVAALSSDIKHSTPQQPASGTLL